MAKIRPLLSPPPNLAGRDERHPRPGKRPKTEGEEEEEEDLNEANYDEVGGATIM